MLQERARDGQVDVAGLQVELLTAFNDGLEGVDQAFGKHTATTR